MLEIFCRKKKDEHYAGCRGYNMDGGGGEEETRRRGEVSKWEESVQVKTERKWLDKGRLTNLAS